MTGSQRAGQGSKMAVPIRMKRFVKILLLSTALLLCSELLGATRESFSDWVVECAGPATERRV